MTVESVGMTHYLSVEPFLHPMERISLIYTRESNSPELHYRQLHFPEPHSIANDPGPKRSARSQPTTLRRMCSSQDRLQINILLTNNVFYSAPI
jgi:hypothetical protein